MRPRHLTLAALLCCFVAAPAPASAQTREQDAVALARTLADGFTAIDARRPQAQAAVDAWYADQGRCAEPARIRSRFRRSTFTAVRWTGLHIAALGALAPDLEQLTQRLRALPVTDRAIRGGIREILLDYRNARRLIKAEPPDLCAVVRSLRRGEPWAKGIGYSEDVRGSIRGLDRREHRLRAAQDALLSVEVDPRLARSLDSVFEHATGGLYRSRLQTREHLTPPFVIVTDAAGLERLHAEAATVAGATQRLFAARRDVLRRMHRAERRMLRCDTALREGAKRRPRGVVTLLTMWAIGELRVATKNPIERFLADLAAVDVTDPALRDLVTRTVERVTLPDVPRTNLCSKLRAWRRAGWAPGAVHVGPDPFAGEIEGGVQSGIRLEDDEIDAAVLDRRGVAFEAAAALLSPLEALLEEPDQSSRTQAVASSVRPASAAVTGRGVWRIAQAIGAEAIGSAGAR